MSPWIILLDNQSMVVLGREWPSVNKNPEPSCKVKPFLRISRKLPIIGTFGHVGCSLITHRQAKLVNSHRCVRCTLMFWALTSTPRSCIVRNSRPIGRRVSRLPASRPTRSPPDNGLRTEVPPHRDSLFSMQPIIIQGL